MSTSNSATSLMLTPSMRRSLAYLMAGVACGILIINLSSFPEKSALKKSRNNTKKRNKARRKTTTDTNHSENASGLSPYEHARPIIISPDTSLPVYSPIVNSLFQNNTSDSGIDSPIPNHTSINIQPVSPPSLFTSISTFLLNLLPFSSSSSDNYDEHENGSTLFNNKKHTTSTRDENNEAGDSNEDNSDAEHDSDHHSENGNHTSRLSSHQITRYTNRRNGPITSIAEARRHKRRIKLQKKRRQMQVQMELLLLEKEAEAALEVQLRQELENEINQEEVKDGDNISPLNSKAESDMSLKVNTQLRNDSNPVDYLSSVDNSPNIRNDSDISSNNSPFSANDISIVEDTSSKRHRPRGANPKTRSSQNLASSSTSLFTDTSTSNNENTTSSPKIISEVNNYDDDEEDDDNGIFVSPSSSSENRHYPSPVIPSASAVESDLGMNDNESYFDPNLVHQQLVSSSILSYEHPVVGVSEDNVEQEDEEETEHRNYALGADDDEVEDDDNDDDDDDDDEDEDEDDDDDDDDYDNDNVSSQVGYAEESNHLLTLLYSIAEDQARKGYISFNLLTS